VDAVTHEKLRSRVFVVPVALLLAGVAARPALAHAWSASIGVAAGVEALDPHFRDYGWDVTPRALLGAAAALRRGRVGLAGSLSRSETTQRQSFAVTPAEQEVALTRAGLGLDVRLAKIGPAALAARAGGGRLHIGYAPGSARVEAAQGSGSTRIDFEPIGAWFGSYGVALSVPIVRALGVEIAASRTHFRIESSHRDGAEIERGEEGFANGSLTCGLHWELMQAPAPRVAERD
jgi:hypothetical protein